MFDLLLSASASLPASPEPVFTNRIPVVTTAVAISTLIVLGGLLLLVSVLGQKRELRKRHFRELAEREARLQLALWGSGEWLWEYRLDRHRLACRELASFLGLREIREISAAFLLRHHVHPDDVRSSEQLLDALRSGEREINLSLRIRSRADTYRWVRWRGKVVSVDHAGHALTLTGTCKDVTSYREVEAEQRLGYQVFESVSDAIAVIDHDGRILKVNPAFTAVTGYGEAEIKGKPVDFLCPPEDESLFEREVLPALMCGGSWQGEHWKRHRSGRRYLSWSRVARISDPEQSDVRFVAVSSDVTERREYEQKLHFLANYDSMTGMLNRSSFLSRLDQLLDCRNDGPLAVLFVDLDNFKQINDSFGHAVGDEVLCAAAHRLETILRGDDVIARFGGDEFVICLERLRHASDAARVADKIVSAFREDLIVSCGPMIVTASVGVSLYPDDGRNSQELLERADTAMYQSKRQGRTRFAFYDGAMSEAARDEFELENQLRHALDNDEFRLHYQPVIDVAANAVVGMEALLRWNKPNDGLVLPASFIHLAEQRNLINGIGEWVLRKACAETAALNAASSNRIYVSVNVSSLQVRDPDFGRRVRDALAGSQLPPGLLQLELTESLILDSNPRILQTLQELRAAGVQLALDDFGTGYSSLSYLRRYPIGRLKIDRSFVADVPDDAHAASLVTTIVALAHLMQMDVTAEGVETRAQRDFLDRLGCRSQQGFYFARSMPHADIQRLVSNEAGFSLPSPNRRAAGH